MAYNFEIPNSISLLPVVHLRNPHYKKFNIPGKVLLNADGTMEGEKFSPDDYNPNIPIEQVPFLACRSLLEELLLNPEFSEDDEGHVITQPYLTTRIRYPGGDTRFVYRSDILVSPDFPDRITAFGRDLILLSLYNSAGHLMDSDAKGWVNLALLNPRDVTTIDYSDDRSSSNLVAKQSTDRIKYLRRRMENAHAG